MTSSASTMRQSLTAADLEGSGFTLEQVILLVKLRNGHSPFREEFDEFEFQRLNFLRWRVINGRLEHD